MMTTVLHAPLQLSSFGCLASTDTAGRMEPCATSAGGSGNVHTSEHKLAGHSPIASLQMRICHVLPTACEAQKDTVVP